MDRKILARLIARRGDKKNQICAWTVVVAVQQEMTKGGRSILQAVKELGTALTSVTWMCAAAGHVFAGDCGWDESMF